MSWDFVGRFDELAALEAAWLAAGGNGAAPIMVVYGEPGIGKTRTVAEFRTAVSAIRRGDIATLNVLRRTSDGWAGDVVRVRVP